MDKLEIMQKSDEYRATLQDLGKSVGARKLQSNFSKLVHDAIMGGDWTAVVEEMKLGGFIK